MLIILEIASVVFVLIYLYYASKLNSNAWLFGIIASIFSGVYFWKLELTGSMVLQIFYALQGVNGYLNWTFFESDRKASYRYTKTYHLVASAILLVLSASIYLWFKEITWGEYEGPNFFDILLALGSIWATQLETKKDIVCWWYWILCNLGYGILYLYLSIHGEGMYYYSALMFFLAIFSYMAKQKWASGISKEHELQSNANKD